MDIQDHQMLSMKLIEWLFEELDRGRLQSIQKREYRVQEQDPQRIGGGQCFGGWIWFSNETGIGSGSFGYTNSARWFHRSTTTHSLHLPHVGTQGNPQWTFFRKKIEFNIEKMARDMANLWLLGWSLIWVWIWSVRFMEPFHL